MALGKGFTNPQRIIDRSFDAFIEGGNDIANQLAKTSLEVQENIRAEKAFAAKQEALKSNEMQTMYTKVNEIGTTSNAALDENITGFFNDKADEYFEIKNAMDKGILSKQEGNKALARTNGLVNQFKEQAAYFAKESAAYQEDLANGNVSSVGSIQNKTILSGLASGANIGLVEKGGRMYYYMPEHEDANGNKVPAAMINGSEMMAKAGAGESLYDKKVDISSNLKQAFNQTYQPTSLESKYVKTVPAVNGQPIPGQPGEVFKNIPEGEKYTYQIIEEEEKNKGQEDLMSNGSLDPLLNNDSIMVRYWQDNVPDEWLEERGYDQSIIDSRWNDFPPDMTDEEKEDFKAKQGEAAKAYMAEQAYDQNADMDNKLKFMQKEKIVKDSGSGSSSSDNSFDLSQENRLKYSTRKEDYNATSEDTQMMYQNGPPEASEYVRALNRNDPGKGYYVNSKGLIQKGKSIVEVPETFEEANKHLNTLNGIDREMQVLFERSSSSSNPNDKKDIKYYLSKG